MLKKIGILVLSLAAFLGAQPYTTLTPERPLAGKEVSWTITKFNQVSESPKMLLVAYTSDSVMIEIIPAKSSDEGWNFTYKIPTEAIFLAFKVEDDATPLLDDNGLFFGVPVFDASGKPVFDANRVHATLYLDPASNRLTTARKYIEEELELYPTNWEALTFLRRLQLQDGEIKEENAVSELDSLLALNPDSLELLRMSAMEFFITSQFAQDKGAELMALCAKEYPESQGWVDYQYSIYSFITSTPQRLAEYEKSVFPLLKGKARESGYFLLMTQALSGPDKNRITDIATRFLAEFPSSSLVTPFIVSMLQTKYEQPTALWLSDMIQWQKKYPTDPELNLQLAEYYRDRDWNQAITYYRNGIKATTEPQASILFAEAASAKSKNLAEAVKIIRQRIDETNLDKYRRDLWWRDFIDRRAMLLETNAALDISLGWVYYKYGKYEEALNTLLAADSLLTVIPEYDQELYQRLLTVSEAAGNVDARRLALLNILLAEPENLSIKNLLQDIYLLDHEDLSGFQDWFFEQKLAISLKQRMNISLPDFLLASLEGDTISVSQFIGKVVVINFWATWCQPCKDEIPDLNNLVTDYQEHDDVVFIGITNEDPLIVTEFLKDNPFDYNIYMDRSDAIYSLFQIDDIPTHLVIDKKGTLEFRHVGLISEIRKVLAAEIDVLLEE